mmetsp:Transcript_8652/g.25600  ORF Transcript_8652/g.25600 Transcript_8652/m.25600 type:complete len:396 (+) Transcript_8652:17-1204(+)|eukprot:6606220-Prymnesium_polylepis.1
MTCGSTVARSRVRQSERPCRSARAQPGASTPYGRGPKAAIVTTVKNFAQLCVSWCAYHFDIGFCHLFIYFDEPSELPSVQTTLHSHFPPESLTLVAHDDALRLAWGRLEGVAQIMPHAATEVQTRQQLNCRHAIGLAVKRRIEWMLHIDADELFHPNGACDACAHFAELDAAGVDTFVYVNHEAVPEAVGISDPFREVTLFKRSLEFVEPTDAAQEAVGLWQQRHHGCFFYYYDNGKAAVRVHPKARPLSVHEWLPGTPKGMSRWYSNMKLPWAGRGNLDQVVQYRASEACVLHYPVCSEDALWQRYLGGMDRYTLAGRREPPPFHDQASHDARAAASKGGEAAARATIRSIFERKVMVDAATAAAQIAAGVCERRQEAQLRLARTRGRGVGATV